MRKRCALFLFTAMMIFCSGNQQQNGSNGALPSLNAVEATVVQKGILIPYLEKPGIVSGINETVVVSETEGIIRSVRFELGEEVDSGAFLLQVDRDAARFALNQARQQLSTAQMNLEASRRLYQDSAISRSEFEQAKSSYNGARAAYETALKQYNNTVVRSPIRGEVASKENGITEGNYLSPGMLVTRIADLSALRLEIAVGEGEIELIQTGATAQVRIPSASPDSVYQARVTAVAAGAQPASGSFPVILTWDNSDSRIRSGMSGTARIRTNERDSVLLIPSAAIKKESDSTSVWRINSGKVYEANVRVGRVMGNTSSIEAGLVPGDTIALTRTTGLSEGDSVIVEFIEEDNTNQ
ncbi:MAG: efflux RND transporter periplasmic adaptor subunit [Chitinispirillaceae bacterium]